MIKSNNLLKLLFVFGVLIISSQVLKSNDYTIKFGGFVKTDAYYDTRQMSALREGHISLWPTKESLDYEGNDINERGNFHILSIQSRQSVKVDGPGIWGGTVSGYVESEFLGSTDATINSLRLRHAFVDLNWGASQIRAGQFWHPLFTTDNIPNVLSFNTGVPFIPFNRSPQIRFTQSFSNMKAFAAIVSQRDFASDGPNGGSPAYVRNSGIPEFALGFGYATPSLAFGLAASAKTLLPNSSVVVNNNTFKVDDKLTTYAVSGNIRTKIDKFHIKTQMNYMQNASDFLMIGGYGVKNLDTDKKTFEYTPISSVSGWLELAWQDKWEFGALFGLTHNLGADDDINGAVYGRGLDIDRVMKVYPRVAYSFQKTKVGIEAEWSKAYYGGKISNTNKKVSNPTSVDNLRILLAFYAFF